MKENTEKKDLYRLESRVPLELTEDIKLQIEYMEHDSDALVNAAMDVLDVTDDIEELGRKAYTVQVIAERHLARVREVQEKYETLLEEFK